MKYAVLVTGGAVSPPPFGYCEQFALIDVDEIKKVILKKELVPSPGGQPAFLPGWLADKGVEVVLSNGMESYMQSLCQQNHIAVIIRIMEVDPEKAVLSHLNDMLTTEDNIW